MSREYQNILETIGHTPLVKLNKLTRGITSTIYVKIESFNPGGSAKDRVGLKMIEAAEREGLLKPGGTIVEATAGNTGGWFSDGCCHQGVPVYFCHAG